MLVLADWEWWWGLSDESDEMSPASVLSSVLSPLVTPSPCVHTSSLVMTIIFMSLVPGAFEILFWETGMLAICKLCVFQEGRVLNDSQDKEPPVCSRVSLIVYCPVLPLAGRLCAWIFPITILSHSQYLKDTCPHCHDNAALFYCTSFAVFPL